MSSASRRSAPRQAQLRSRIDELLAAAEYIMAGGNQRVILCERGIRTFETATRSTLDVSAVPVLKERTHLPVIVDPSHAAGRRELVIPLALAAVAAGADACPSQDVILQGMAIQQAMFLEPGATRVVRSILTREEQDLFSIRICSRADSRKRWISSGLAGSD